MTYLEFKQKLDQKVFTDDLNYEILLTCLKNPERYTGLFRITNAKTKLIQNLTQSCEIKFGNFLEDVFTSLIEEMGYENLNKNINSDKHNITLHADQIFRKNSSIYLIEQKVRDDHDSTKKRGQYKNFEQKIQLIKQLFPKDKIVATMWFSDDSIQKNKKYYSEMIKKNTDDDIEIYLFYGGDIFKNLFHRYDVWETLIKYLNMNKSERSEEILSVPDFDTSEEIRKTLFKIKENKPSLIKKLFSKDKKYIQLREELFPTGKNLEDLL